jgi:hypothetical protein
LNLSALVQSINKIIQRHENLRTSFELLDLDGEPVQQVAEVVSLTVT